MTTSRVHANHAIHTVAHTLKYQESVSRKCGAAVSVTLSRRSVFETVVCWVAQGHVQGYEDPKCLESLFARVEFRATNTLSECAVDHLRVTTIVIAAGSVVMSAFHLDVALEWPLELKEVIITWFISTHTLHNRHGDGAFSHCALAHLCLGHLRT